MARQRSRLALDRTYEPNESALPWLEGLPISVYGDSGGYVGLTVPSGGTVYPYCSVNYTDRIQRRLGNPAGVPGNNNSVVGAQANEVAMYACSTQTGASRKGTAVAGTWTPSALPTGVVLVGCVANDVIHYAGGSGAKGIAGCQNGLDGIVRILQAQSVLQDTNAAFSYTGTWTSQASSALPGGNSHYTSTNGNHVTVTTPTGTDFDLMLLGWDDPATGAGTFATFTVTVDGGAVSNFSWNPGTTSLQAKVGASIGAGFTSVPLCVPLRGLSNTTHSVVVTHNDTTGRFLYVSQLLTHSPTPPTIVFLKWIYPGAAGLSAAGITTAQIDQFNGYIDTVAARFTDGSVLVADPLHNGWNSGTMISSQDPNHIHPNDLGMKCWADTIMRLLAQQQPPRHGLIIQ